MALSQEQQQGSICLLPSSQLRNWTFLEVTEDPDIFYFTPFSALYLKGL